jgi:hypothetical protein
MMIAGVAAAHLLYDPHTVALPLWGERRFLPILLPVTMAATAATVAWVATRISNRVIGPGVAVVLACGALAGVAWPARELWGSRYYEGGSDIAASLAAALPQDAVVLIDPTLAPALLDVPLLLVHGRDAVQLTGTAGRLGPLAALQAILPDRPIFLLRSGVLPPPTSVDPPVEARGAADVSLLVPGVRGRDGAPIRTWFPIAIFRVESPVD